MRKWVLILGIGGALVACGDGGDSGADEQKPGAGDNVEPVGSVGVVEGGLYSDLLVAGDTVYACTAEHGLRIATLDEAGAITTTADQVDLQDSEGCRSLAMAPDGFIFVAGETIGGGSWVARLAGDGTGTIVSRTTIATGLVETITATDTHVIAALGHQGIEVLGLTDGQLASVSTLSTGFERALGAAVWGDRIIIANGLKGLAIVDWSNPAAPSHDSQIDTRGTARRVAVQGDTVYVADVGGGISLVDLSTGAVAAEWDTHGSSVDLDVEGDLLAVANLEDLALIDISDGGLTLVGTEVLGTNNTIAGRTIAVDISNNLLVAAEWAGLWTLNYNVAAPTPDIHLSRTSVNLGKVGLKKSQGIIVQNLGNADLEIESITVTHPDFTAILDQDLIVPGAKTLLEVVYEPSVDGAITAELQLATNDPDETTLIIPLAANQPGGIQVGVEFESLGLAPYTQYATGNEVTVSGEHSGKVAILAYFGTS